jgi:hypothetical protein
LGLCLAKNAVLQSTQIGRGVQRGIWISPPSEPRRTCFCRVARYFFVFWRDLPIRRAMGDPRVDDAPGRPRRRGARVYRGVSGSSTKVRLLRGSTARPRDSSAPCLAQRRLTRRGAGRRHTAAWQDGVQRSRGVELWSTAGGALWWSSPRHLYKRARRAVGPSRARRRRADRPSRAEWADLASAFELPPGQCR